MVRLGEGEGVVVGTGMIWAGRISMSVAEVTRRILVVILYWPIARMRLLTSLGKLTLVGACRAMASGPVVSR